MAKMRKFTRKELSNYNGKNGKPIYFAYKGKVYDATGSFLWKGGSHQVLHEAGQDLTEHLKKAPHGESPLKRLPIIGDLTD